MYKVICALFLIILLLVSCNSILELQKQYYSNKKSSEEGYKDGIYTEEGEIWKYGNENATVVISGGRITDITLRKLDSSGREENYEKWSENNGEGRPNLKKYRIDLLGEMIKKQTYNVDSISGATISSENWKRAVRKALDKAKKR